MIESVPEELRMLNMEVDPAVAWYTSVWYVNDACDHLEDAFTTITGAAPSILCTAPLATMTK